jgi:hypothetical protein
VVGDSDGEGGRVTLVLLKVRNFSEGHRTAGAQLCLFSAKVGIEAWR